MRFYFFLIFALSFFVSEAQSSPNATAPSLVVASDTSKASTVVRRMGIVTDTMGQYKVLVSRRLGGGLRVRHAMLLRRMEVMSDGTGRELERYLVDNRRRRIKGDVWNALQLSKK